MLPGLVVLISVINIGLAFYVTTAFRRDRVRRRIQATLLAWEFGETVEDRPPAETDANGETAEGADAASDPCTGADGDGDEATENPSDAQSRPAPSRINPRKQHPIEELFYRAGRMVEDLATIDHAMLAGQADDPAAEEELKRMWPALTRKSAPIEILLQEAEQDQREDEDPMVAATRQAIIKTGRKVLRQIHNLAGAMSSGGGGTLAPESGLHDLRDLFTLACVFRDQCADFLVDGLSQDHHLYGGTGKVAFKQAVEQLSSSEDGKEYWAIGFEIDHLREMNSLHGALIINGILAELQETMQQDDAELIHVCRHHGQHFAALAEGNAESVSAIADRVRQRFNHTTFRAEGKTVNATLSAAVVPVSIGAAKLLGRLGTTIAEAKAKGYNRVVCDRGDYRAVVAAAAAEIEPREVTLEL